jgi:hypothetical protein
MSIGSTVAVDDDGYGNVSVIVLVAVDSAQK